jgi:hypothetical protein
VQGFLAEEDVGENWLDDDMASATRPNKKRRLATPIEKHRCIGTKMYTTMYLRQKALLYYVIYYLYFILP